MCNKLICVCALVALLCLAPVALANNYTDAGPTHFFDDPNNWKQGVPFESTGGGERWGNVDADGAICLITEPMDVNSSGLYAGTFGGDNSIIMTGGYLYVWYFNVGRGRAHGAHEGSIGYFLMTGGVVEARSELKIPNQFDEQEFGPWEGTRGHMDLYGGTFWVHNPNFHMGTRDPHVYNGGTGTMDVTEGTLVVMKDAVNPGAVVDKIQGYIDSGWITAYARFGAGELVLDDDVVNPGYVTLSALPADPNEPGMAGG